MRIETVCIRQPSEPWTILRGDDGYASMHRVSKDRRVQAMLAAGALLPELRAEDFLTTADPKLV